MWAILALVFFSLLISISTALAEPTSAVMPDNPRYVFHSIGDDVGLDTRGVTAMIQDSNGFVWVGSQDGLFRCDGAEVHRFTKEDGLPDSWIRQLEEGPDGTIWFLAGGKIGRYDGLNFSLFSPPEGVNFNLPPLYYPQRLALGPKGAIYVATEAGLWAMQTDGSSTSKLWTKNDGLPASKSYAVLTDKQGTVWVATEAGIATLYPYTGVVKNWSVEKETIIEEGASLVIDNEGTAWFRTMNHLHFLKRDSTKFLPIEPRVAQAGSMGMPSTDRSGQLLLPSALGLIFRKDGQWHTVSTKNGLRTNSVTFAIEDREGGLWIGLTGVGVQRWTGRDSWAAWTSEEGLPDNGAWGSVRDRLGRLWVGTNNGIGVWLPDEHRWAYIQRKDGLVGDRLWKLALGPQGWVWSLSRRLGFDRINPKTLAPEKLVTPFPIKGRPMEIATAPDGGLWIGTTEMVVRVSSKNDALVFEKVELPEPIKGSHEVIKFAEDGSIWMGGTNGAGLYDGEKWTHFSTKDGLQPSRIMNLAAISSKEAWFGYYEGVGATRFRISGSEIQADQIGRAEGLASDRVWLLERDRDGNVWIGGSDGLSVVDRKGDIRIYDRGDGLLWNDINQGAFQAQSDGSVLIGTGRGLAYHKPVAKRRSVQPPTLALTSVELGGEQALRTTKPATDYDQNTFVARYAGLTFRNPTKVRYRYKLIGWDDEILETRQREVRYAALPAGRYTFEVSCRSADGDWSVSPVQYSFRIRPPWWERWWTRVGAMLLLGALITGLLQFRTRRLAADRKRLEKAVKERNAQLREVNEELKEMSFTDSLTKTRNRRFFSTVIDADVSATLRKHYTHALEYKDPNRDLLFFIIDLDHFKRVNDIYGHSAGDTVLVETSRRLNDSLRQSDLLVRWGGEEFLILCREARRSDGKNVARRILNVVGSKPFEIAGGEKIRRTCSVGWASLPAYLEKPGALPHETVLELADKALYVAKQTGRNRAVGVELIEKAQAETEHSDWLDEPIEELNGKLLSLVTIPGPVVPADSIPSRPPNRSSHPPPSMMEKKSSK